MMYAIAMDALNHDGPADPAGLDRAVCAEAFAPYVDPVTFPAAYAKAWAEIWTQLATYPQVTEEPPLKPYARGWRLRLATRTGISRFVFSWYSV